MAEQASNLFRSTLLHELKSARALKLLARSVDLVAKHSFYLILVSLKFKEE